MRKIVKDGYILGVGNVGDEISTEEYNAILNSVEQKPTAPEGYGYRLKDNLEWELFKIEGGGL